MAAGNGSSAAARGVQVLHPGDVAVANRGERMETLLGSCIAIILTDPRRTIGCMCHIVHAGEGQGNAHAEPAIRAMSQRLARHGIHARLCEAYVYGGGNMFPSLFQHAHIGERNAEWVFASLDRLGVKLLAHDVGGDTYRRLGWTVGAEAPQVDAVPIDAGST